MAGVWDIAIVVAVLLGAYLAYMFITQPRSILVVMSIFGRAFIVLAKVIYVVLTSVIMALYNVAVWVIRLFSKKK